MPRKRQLTLSTGDRESKKAKLSPDEDKLEGKKQGIVHIGCSGYNYPGWRKGVFYPTGLVQKKEFDFYSNKFDTLEINNTFYNNPKLSTWQSWYERAPPGFVYVVKVNQWVTHRRKLNNVQDSWDRVWEGAKHLKEHLGPFLFQLPGNMGRNVERLRKLADVLPKGQRYAFEFREPSWWHESVYEVLRENNWALVILPPCPGFPEVPFVEEFTADWTYIRWHGSEGKYNGSYSNNQLQTWSEKIKGWIAQGIDVYGYFNNDIGASAPQNARKLADYLSNK